MSSASIALIWWAVPLLGLLGALGYVLWVTQFKRKFEQETTRSVGQFQRFQEAFHSASVTIKSEGEEPQKPAQGNSL